MKKTLSLLLVFLLALSLLSSCAKEEPKPEIYTLNGTTGFGMASLICDAASAEAYNFHIEKDPTLVRDALINGTADIAALPTNIGAALYNATNGGVRVLALNTGGVLYAVTTEMADTPLHSLADLSGKTLYCPAQNPTFITRALLDEAGVENVSIDSTTYASPEQLQQAVASGLVAYAILPEPMVTIAANAAKSHGGQVTVSLDLSAVWNTYFENGSLVQGCLVVRTAYLEENGEAVKAFLEAYRASVDFVSEDPSAAADLIVRAGIFKDADVARLAIPKCNIRYTEGEAMKQALSAFLAEMPLAAIGGAIPADDFYQVTL